MENYIKEKLKILRQLGVSVNKKQRAYMNSLKSEIAVDNFAHDLIFGVKSCSPWETSKFNSHSKYLGSKRVISI